MIPRSSLPRAVPRVLRPQCSKRPNNNRTLASVKSGGFNYETGEVNGVKFASRDIPGPTTQLAVVARAGTRFQVYPGFAEGLEKFAFKVRLCLFDLSRCEGSFADFFPRACVVNTKKIIPTDYQGSRTARSRTLFVPFKGEPGCWR